jgi:DNA-binding PucR family transcriptional regulator
LEYIGGFEADCSQRHGHVRQVDANRCCVPEAHYRWPDPYKQYHHLTGLLENQSKIQQLVQSQFDERNSKLDEM